ncbi:hypothetical protein [Natronosalvus rutilus]|uniref:Uncharacterized protein n=1 Tax=Natronosalvus rutilus TaxID=2953753 RepID=A0A9E7N9R0_9EURY|nr:hypothetical protein [Natronosalvus rutilus]UTF53401.1 hypothetical protein NGM29_16785 [Natronosalvus rutilus]
MPAIDTFALTELFRTAPVETALVVVTPVVLAVAQLAIGVITDGPLLPAIGFAIVMGAFAAVAAGFLEATHRRRRLEVEVERASLEP